MQHDATPNSLFSQCCTLCSTAVISAPQHTRKWLRSSGKLSPGRTRIARHTHAGSPQVFSLYVPVLPALSCQYAGLCLRNPKTRGWERQRNMMQHQTAFSTMSRALLDCRYFGSTTHPKMASFVRKAITGAHPDRASHPRRSTASKSATGRNITQHVTAFSTNIPSSSHHPLQ